MKKALFVAVVLAAASTSAMAENTYVFGDVGRSNIDTGLSSDANFKVDESDTSYKIGIGYQVNQYFSVEAGYADLGETTLSTNAPYSEVIYGSNVTIDGKFGLDAAGFFVGAKGSYPVTNEIGVYAKAGLIAWESDLSYSGSVTVDGDTLTGSGSEEASDGTDPYIGLGASYSINDNLSVQGEWSRYMLDFEGEDADIDVFSVGVAYAF